MGVLGLLVLSYLGFILLCKWYNVARETDAGDRLLRRSHRVYGQEARRISGRRLYLRAAHAMADSVDGSVLIVGPRAVPRVLFRYRAARCILTVYEGGRRPKQLYTQVTYTMPRGWNRRVELFPQRLSDAQVRLIGVQDIPIGDPGFDERYLIRASSYGTARDFFTPAVRTAIDRIRALGSGPLVEVSIDRERMTVRKAPALVEGSRLIELVDACSVLYDRIEELATATPGVAVLQVGEGEEPPACPVCGSLIEGELAGVSCRRCRTPHHGECWEYNRQCAVFACGETGFVRA